MRWQNLKLLLVCLLHDIGKIHPSYYHAKYYGYRDRHAITPFEIYPELSETLNFDLPKPLDGLRAWEIIRHHHSTGYNPKMEIFRKADREDFHRHLVFAPAQSRMPPERLQIVDWLGRMHRVPLKDGKYILRHLLMDLTNTLSSGEPFKLLDFIRSVLKPVLTQFPADNRQPLSHITLWDHGIATYIYLLGVKPPRLPSSAIPIYPVWKHTYIMEALPKWEKLIGGMAGIVMQRLKAHDAGLTRHIQNTRIAWEKSRLQYIRRQMETLKSSLPNSSLPLEELTSILSEMMCTPKPPSPRNVAIPILLKYIHARWKLGLTHTGALIFIFGTRKITLASRIQMLREIDEIPPHIPPGKYIVRIKTPSWYPPWWTTYTTPYGNKEDILLMDGIYLTGKRPKIVFGSISNPLKTAPPRMGESDHRPTQAPASHP